MVDFGGFYDWNWCFTARNRTFDRSQTVNQKKASVVQAPLVNLRRPDHHGQSDRTLYDDLRRPETETDRRHAGR